MFCDVLLKFTCSCFSFTLSVCLSTFFYPSEVFQLLEVLRLSGMHKCIVELTYIDLKCIP